MENIAPSLDLIIYIKQNLLLGRSLRFSIQLYLQRAPHTAHAQTVAVWLARCETGKNLKSIREQIPSVSLQRTLELLEFGLQGHPIHSRLVELEQEIKILCQRQLDNELATLPLKVLCPLVFLMFPAFLIMLFAPILNSLILEMGR